VSVDPSWCHGVASFGDSGKDENKKSMRVLTIIVAVAAPLNMLGCFSCHIVMIMRVTHSHGCIVTFGDFRPLLIVLYHYRLSSTMRYF
jgi:hypothetical protein